MWEIFRENFGPAFTLWQSLDAERRAELDEAMEACFEGHRTGRRDQHGAPLHHRHRHSHSRLTAARSYSSSR